MSSRSHTLSRQVCSRSLPGVGRDSRRLGNRWEQMGAIFEDRSYRMRLEVRVLVTMLVIAGAGAGQQALRAHLAPVQNEPPTPLQKPLAQLPLQLGAWTGEDRFVADEPRYADEHLRRVYRHAGRNQGLTVWLAYSGVGADRTHHPEVCLSVAGQREDQDVRQSLPLPGGGEPIQQYKFRGLAGTQWVFYWHYRLPSSRNPDWDSWQRLYQQIQRRSSSLTLEVFAPSLREGDDEAARDFVRLLDAAIRKHVGPDAVRGSERLPVVVIDGLAPSNFAN